MTAIGYLRVSTEDQDVEKQRHLLNDFAQKNKILIDEFIKVEISSRKNQRERRIEELQEKLSSGDTLIVAELSRLGRNMLETLNLVTEFSESGIKIIFVRQPELSTNGPHAKLLLAIYSYFAESERDFISMRTKQGLAAARASGKTLGRPKGTRNKKRALDVHRNDIKDLLEKGLDLANIRRYINPKLDKPITFQSYKYFVEHDAELHALWKSK